MNSPTSTRALAPVDQLPPGPLTSAELADAVPDAGDRQRYRRIWHGVYRREDQADDLWLRSLTLARTWPEGVLRGRSAALLWGEDSAPVDAPPEIWLPATRRSRPGRVYRYGILPREAVTEVDGVRATTPLRTCRDLAVDLSVEDAVVAAERMCARDPDLAGLLRTAVEHPSGRSARRFAEVVALVDPRTASVDESRARVLLATAGFDRFVRGHEVRLGGRSLTLPLADPAARCAVLIRTDDHPHEARPWDERASDDLRLAGWTLVVVVEGAAVSTGSTGMPEGGVVSVLRSRWPATEVLVPVDAAPADDPHGMWSA